MIHVLDNFIEDPLKYREDALRLEYTSHVFPECTFHGIAIGGRSGEVAAKLASKFRDMQPTLTFFRKSPVGQVEPHFIHTDIDMGKVSAVLYLNPKPPRDDGTSFWTHTASGEIQNITPHARSKEGQQPDDWDLRMFVPAKFNRIVIFPSSFYHSRNIFGNWGNGDDARLTQVTFGELKP